MSGILYATVVVNRKVSAVDKTFDYIVPEELKGQINRGSIVRIPFGHQFLEGIVVDFSDTSSISGLKEIAGLISPRPLFNAEMLALSKWVAEYYLCPWVLVLQAMLPAGLTLTGRLPQKTQIIYYQSTGESQDIKLTAARQKALNYLEIHKKATASELAQAGITDAVLKGLIAKGCVIKKQKQLDFSFRDDTDLVSTTTFNEEQQAAFAALLNEYNRDKRPFLLFGVTGSGKTEIYLQMIEKVVSEGKQAIFLVPEIALSTQMVDMLRRRLPYEIAILHSGLQGSQRRLTWQNIAEGKYQVVLGARSAVFAPLPNLGLIVLDEEQEGSYKQENVPRFNAREVARERCRLTGAQLLMGSATPLVESYYKATSGEYAYAHLENRFYNSSLPMVEVVDMREELRDGNRSIFSRALQKEIALRLENKEQVMLLLNRRGYYTSFTCRICGSVMLCPHCDIPLAYHDAENVLKCHYCGRQFKPPPVCPKCGSNAIRHLGTGTQRVAEEVQRLFPEALVARMDHDVMNKIGNYDRIYHDMQAGKIDILVGTQMISKGLDFSDVTLSGVIAADLSLNQPDFRAQERTFQLLTQITGRSGRRNVQGKAIIQTYNPQAIPIIAAANHDYELFYQQELQTRKENDYPPFGYLLWALFTGFNLNDLISSTAAVEAYLEEIIGDKGLVCGPAPAMHGKIKNRYRRQILLKSDSLELLRQAIVEAWSKANENKEVKKDILLSIDVEPMTMI